MRPSDHQGTADEFGQHGNSGQNKTDRYVVRSPGECSISDRSQEGENHSQDQRPTEVSVQELMKLVDKERGVESHNAANEAGEH